MKDFPGYGWLVAIVTNNIHPRDKCLYMEMIRVFPLTFISC